MNLARLLTAAAFLFALGFAAPSSLRRFDPVTALTRTAAAQGYEPRLFGEMRWRSIGPLRGGRAKSITGVSSQPNVFYMGVVNGGVWKTTDYGRTWMPIFDDQPTGSIGAVAVAISPVGSSQW